MVEMCEKFVLLWWSEEFKMAVAQKRRAFICIRCKVRNGEQVVVLERGKEGVEF